MAKYTGSVSCWTDDAWIAHLQLRGAAAAPDPAAGPATLAREIEEAATLCQGAAWATDDPHGGSRHTRSRR
jgi:hypothetical protein